MALRNLGIEHEVVAIAEIDKFAIKSYEAIHGETNNLGDISKIKTEDIPDHDLFTYSFPCQDISVAGKGLGLDEGSGTRSGLLWECQKVIAVKKPKYLLLENVKNLVGKKHKHNFDKWLEWLEEQGYTNYWQVLNAKDYGIPQNRERVFVVSILGDHEPYEFPEPIELELRLKDILEDEVDEKFYLDDERVSQLTFKPKINNEYSDRISEPKIEQVAQYDTPTRKNSNRFRTYDKRGISSSVTGMGGGGLEPHVMLDGIELPTIGASRGRNPENPSDRTVGTPTEQRLEINKNGTSNTITTVQKDNLVVEGVDVHPFSKKMEFRGYKQKEVSSCLLATDYKAPETILESQVNNFRIRKLTPKECWRLMGCSDEDFHKAEQVNSNSQLYKQAGNAIVVDVLEGIFEKLFKE